MPDDIAGPEIPALPYSDELGLRAAYARIELIRLHFVRCCASRTGQCRYSTDVLMTSDQTPHTARWSQHAAADGQGAWVVSWLPQRLMTRDQAATAMALAEVVATEDLSPEHDLCPHVEGWAAELGITAEEAIRRIAT